MSYSWNDKIIALAGIFQAASLVQKIATSGNCDHFYYERSLKSLFVMSPPTTEAVYQNSHGIQLGLRTLLDILNKDSGPENVEIIRYALSLIHLERKLSAQPQMLDIISKRLEQLEPLINDWSENNERIVHNLAGLYSDTLSTFKVRIQVSGNPNHLQNKLNAAKIRALLLSGIRAAMLWRQVGGRRWQLVFQRGRVTQTTKSLII